MAVRFDFEAVTSAKNWIVKYPSAQGYSEKFLEFCNHYIKASEFPNVDCEVQDFKSGGLLFNKEVTPMLCVSFRKSQFKKLGIYFRAQQFGNVILFQQINTLEKGFWDAVKGRSQDEIESMIFSKCKNWAQREEYSALTSLGDLVFESAMNSVDPDYKERKLS